MEFFLLHATQALKAFTLNTHIHTQQEQGIEINKL